MKNFKYTDLGESIDATRAGDNTNWSSCGCGISFECKTHNCGTQSDCQSKYCRRPEPKEKPSSELISELSAFLAR